MVMTESKVWQWFETIMGFICRWLAALGLTALIAISALTVVDAVLRRYFGGNIHGLSDAVEWCMIVGISACFPAMIWGRHAITVRVVGKISHWRVHEGLELLGHLLLFATLVVISWQLSLYTYDIWLFGDVSMLLLWPKWPVWLVGSVIWCFTALTELVMLVEQVLRFTARTEPKAVEMQEGL